MTTDENKRQNSEITERQNLSDRYFLDLLETCLYMVYLVLRLFLFGSFKNSRNIGLLKSKPKLGSKTFSPCPDSIIERESIKYQ